jgi:ribosomal protein L31
VIIEYSFENSITKYNECSSQQHTKYNLDDLNILSTHAGRIESIKRRFKEEEKIPGSVDLSV